MNIKIFIKEAMKMGEGGFAEERKIRKKFKLKYSGTCDSGRICTIFRIANWNSLMGVELLSR